MAPSRSRDRDAGMRKISIATRMFAGAGIVLVGAFSAFLASRSTGSGSAGTVNSVTSPVATAPPSTLAPDSSGASAQSVPTTPTLPPETNPPHIHVRSGGS